MVKGRFKIGAKVKNWLASAKAKFRGVSRPPSQPQSATSSTSSLPSNPSIPLSTAKPLASLTNLPSSTTDQLPKEIYIAIISHLRTSDLARWSRVSRSMGSIAAWQLPRSVRTIVFPPVREDYDTGEMIDDLPRWVKRGKLVIDYLPPGRQAGIRAHLAALDTYTSSFLILPTVLQASVAPPSPASDILHRHSFATSLTIPTHRHETCVNLSPLVMPSLITLRIAPDGADCSARSSSRCPLTLNLHPRQLILGGEYTDLTVSVPALWTSSIPPPSLKELVFIVGAYSDNEESRDPTKTFLDKLPETVERLTLVMWTWQGGWHAGEPWHYHGELDMRGIDPDGEFSFRSEGLREGLALACCGKSKVVEVVGLETTTDEFLDSPQAIREEIVKIREEVKRRLMVMGWAEKVAEVRADEIRFMDGWEWLGSEVAASSKEAVGGVILKDFLDNWGHEHTEEDEI